jgi:hypothetical protein
MTLPKTFYQPWYSLPDCGSCTAKIYDSRGEIVAEGVEVSDAASIVAAMHEKNLPRQNGWQTGLSYVIVGDKKDLSF